MQTFTSALYSLAAEPEKYADILRNEVLDSLEDGQITTETLAKLPKMDSFLRESARFNNAGLSKNSYDGFSLTWWFGLQSSRATDY